MYTEEQHKLLEHFANISDKLFDRGIITTDSFTGEIGEYIVCKQLKLNKTARVTKAVDAISSNGKKYQIKAKVITGDSYSYKITNLDTKSFHFLAVIYFDKDYTPLRILVIPASKIKGEEISITSSILNSGIKIIEEVEIKIPVQSQNAITKFARAYQKLKDNGIIRSMRVVGDIGEYYACKRLNLILSENKVEKGIDARSKNGTTYEIKTRRVYESGRRVSETRRINGLVGKDAQYLIVVVLDKSFQCAGMWVMPMKNIINPSSANLKIVNTTVGVKNLVPSKVSWLDNKEKYSSSKGSVEKVKIVQGRENAPKIKLPIATKKQIEQNQLTTSCNNEVNSGPNRIGYIEWFIIIGIILALISEFA